ncbi:MAG: hypothetical protein LBT09_06760 [Planctomycetaceae bacterium]|jgi:hypothetical protein|nr:hypothetical protein [Planctomycetaceae bacterium]
MTKICIVNPQNIEFYIENLKSNNRKIKLDALNAIQWYVEARFSYRKELTGEEIWIANSLLECLIGETRNKVIDEILDALCDLTGCIYVPQANWEILASEFLRFKKNWLIDQSICLLGRTCSAKYIDLIRPFCTNDNPQIAETANNAIFEIEYVCSKIK